MARGTAWCGQCGARVDPAPVEVHTEEPPQGSTTPRRSGNSRWLAAGVLAVLVVGALVAAVLRPPPVVPLLGTPAGAAGQSASGPPPDGLRLAWSTNLVPDEQFRGLRTGGGTVVTRDGRVVVDGRVLDLDTGRLVGLVPGVRMGADGRGASITDGALVLVDVASGAVLQRARLPGELAAWEVERRLGDVTVLVEPGGTATVMVTDDGEVLGRVQGMVASWLDRAADDAAALPVRVGAEVEDAVRLVTTSDGSVVRELDHDGPQAVDVVGSRAAVAVPVTGDVGEPGTGSVWRVRLLDATTGTDLTSVQLTSAVAPRLLGSFDDGAAAIATRSGSEVVVWRLEGTGPAGALTQLRVNAVRGGTVSFDEAFFTGGDSLLAGVGMAGGLVVLHDVDEGRLVAVDDTGTQVWRASATGVAGIAVGGEHVAVLPDDRTRPTRLFRVDDGSPAGVVPSLASGLQWSGAPVAVLDGTVAVGDDGGGLGQAGSPGSSLRWLDLRTGDLRSADEVLGAVGVTTPTGPDWWLVGTERDPAGRLAPVVVRHLERGEPQLLTAAGTFEGLDLGGAATDGPQVYEFVTRVVGRSPTHLAFFQDGFDTTGVTTSVVDRETRAVVDLEGVWGVALADDVLLGLVVDVGFGPGSLRAIDPDDGTVRWERGDARVLLPFGTGELAVEGDLLVASRVGGVEAVDTSDGSRAWLATPDVAIGQHLALGSTRVVVSTAAGAVLALDRSDGVEVWRAELGTPPSALTLAGDAVLVGTADGLVVHLDGDGREVQRVAVGAGPVTAVAALGDTVLAMVDGAAVGLRPDGTGVVERDEVDLP